MGGNKGGPYIFNIIRKPTTIKFLKTNNCVEFYFNIKTIVKCQN